MKKQEWIIIVQYVFRSIRRQEEKLLILNIVRFDLKTIRQKISDVVKGAACAAADELRVVRATGPQSGLPIRMRNQAFANEMRVRAARTLHITVESTNGDGLPNNSHGTASHANEVQLCACTVLVCSISLNTQFSILYEPAISPLIGKF